MNPWISLFLIIVGVCTCVTAQTVSLANNQIQYLAPTTNIYFGAAEGLPHPDIGTTANSSALILYTPGSYYIFCNVTGTPIQNLGGVFNGASVPIFAAAGPFPYAYVGYAITEVPTVMSVVNLDTTTLSIVSIVFEITLL
jgi:hypothetical protein